VIALMIATIAEKKVGEIIALLWKQLFSDRHNSDHLNRLHFRLKDRCKHLETTLKRPENSAPLFTHGERMETDTIKTKSNRKTSNFRF